MTLYPATERIGREPTHPGAILSVAVEAIGKSKVEIAGLLGISRQQLYDILGERQAISPNVAARIGKLVGNGPGLWLRMQATYDAWHAERDIDVSAIPTLAAAE